MPPLRARGRRVRACGARRRAGAPVSHARVAHCVQTFVAQTTEPRPCAHARS
ncbi:hypothetical protein BURMUCGD2_1443 [Burkholderia multivorans CGD2]|uniref:Uncharacterized protein n=1 Tax=Burkholderia multivorans CGD2 TaxID=513052 RepID=B9BYZ0_9BURK|nr:hypothetical protein BURMUCGD2_1443 [Burkholderia multivorans CGD2]